MISKVQTRTLFWALLVLLVTEVGASFLLNKTVNYRELILCGARLVEIFFLLFVVSVHSEGMSSLGLAREQIAAGLKQGLIWSFFFGLISFLVFLLLRALNVDALKLIRTGLPLNINGLIWFFIRGGLIAPVAEEIFFRGIIYGFLRRWGVPVAVIGATIIFAAAHLTGSSIPATQIVGGIVFALAYEKSGSLMAPITVHAMGNIAIFTLSLL